VVYDNTFSNTSETLGKMSLQWIEVLEDICIHVIDAKGCTTYYSKGCEKIEGYKRHEVIGKHITETYWTSDKKKLDESNSIIIKALSTGKPIKNKQTKTLTKYGKLITLVSSAYPIIGDGELLGVIMAYNDTTQIGELSSVITRLQKDMLNQKKLATKNGTSFQFPDLIGSSKVMHSTIKIAKKIADSASEVLIVGPTGTGKELFAQSIHNYSPISEGRFVAINCSSVPETLLESTLFGTSKGAFTGATDSKGLFEQANNGTLFLDELNSSSMAFQASLLRVLETNKIRKVGGNTEIPVNVRIISAMNIDPLEAVKKKELREDLYYRLSTLTLELPPLKKRIGDIEELVMEFIDKGNELLYRDIKGISDEALYILKRYDWPGNVRQLKHCIDYAMNMTDSSDIMITSDHLAKQFMREVDKRTVKDTLAAEGTINLVETVKEYERKLIIEHLKKNKGNVNQTAIQFGMPRQKLHYRLKTLNILEFEYKPT